LFGRFGELSFEFGRALLGGGDVGLELVAFLFGSGERAGQGLVFGEGGEAGEEGGSFAAVVAGVVLELLAFSRGELERETAPEAARKRAG